MDGGCVGDPPFWNGGLRLQVCQFCFVLQFLVAEVVIEQCFLFVAFALHDLTVNVSLTHVTFREPLGSVRFTKTTYNRAAYHKEVWGDPSHFILRR